MHVVGSSVANKETFSSSSSTSETFLSSPTRLLEFLSSAHLVHAAMPILRFLAPESARQLFIASLNRHQQRADTEQSKFLQNPLISPNAFLHTSQAILHSLHSYPQFLPDKSMVKNIVATPPNDRPQAIEDITAEHPYAIQRIQHLALLHPYLNLIEEVFGRGSHDAQEDVAYLTQKYLEKVNEINELPAEQRVFPLFLVLFSQTTYQNSEGTTHVVPCSQAVMLSRPLV